MVVRTSLVGLSAFALVTLSVVSPVLAQRSALLRGIELFDRADFDGAIEAFDEAEAGDGLERAEILDLYERRAGARLALGEREAMMRDLRKLASLDHEHELGPATRPEVREAFARAQAERPALDVSVGGASEVGGARLSAAVANDPDALVRVVRVVGRTSGGEWLSGDGSVFVPATAGANVEYYATAIGPGGSTVAAVGAADAPRTYAYSYSGPISDVEDTGGEDDEEGGGGLLVGLIIGGVVLAVIAAIVIAVVATSSNDATQPGAPMIYD